MASDCWRDTEEEHTLLGGLDIEAERRAVGGVGGGGGGGQRCRKLYN